MDKFEEIQKEFKEISNEYKAQSELRQKIISFIKKANDLQENNPAMINQVSEMFNKLKPIIEEINSQSDILDAKAEDWKNKNK